MLPCSDILEPKEQLLRQCLQLKEKGESTPNAGVKTCEMRWTRCLSTWFPKFKQGSCSALTDTGRRCGWLQNPKCPSQLWLAHIEHCVSYHHFWLHASNTTSTYSTRTRHSLTEQDSAHTRTLKILLPNQSWFAVPVNRIFQLSFQFWSSRSA